MENMRQSNCVFVLTLNQLATNLIIEGVIFLFFYLGQLLRKSCSASIGE